MAELEIKPSAGMKARVSGVILVGCLIAGVIVWLLTGGGGGLFARKVDLITYMPDATGLGVGSSVRLDGIQIGAVKTIAISGYLDRQRSVRLILRIESLYLPKIPVDSMTSIGADTLIGNKFLNIDEGKAVATVTAGALLRSQDAAQAADQSDLIASLQNSLKRVDTMLEEVSSPDTAIGHYVVGDKEYDQILRTVAVFEKSMRDVVAQGNPTGDALFTMKLYNQIEKPLQDLDNTMQAIQKGEGPMGRLYASDAQYNAILTQLRDLRKTIAQMRTDMASLAPQLRDETTYERIRRMLESTDAMLAALNRGEGKAGQLLTNAELYESLAGSMKSLDELLRDFQGNPKKYLRVKVF